MRVRELSTHHNWMPRAKTLCNHAHDWTQVDLPRSAATYIHSDVWKQMSMDW